MVDATVTQMTGLQFCVCSVDRYLTQCSDYVLVVTDANLVSSNRFCALSCVLK